MQASPTTSGPESGTVRGSSLLDSEPVLTNFGDMPDERIVRLDTSNAHSFPHFEDMFTGTARHEARPPNNTGR